MTIDPAIWDLAKLVLTVAGALVGAYLGVRWKGGQEREAWLRDNRLRAMVAISVASGEVAKATKAVCHAVEKEENERASRQFNSSTVAMMDSMTELEFICSARLVESVARLVKYWWTTVRGEFEKQNFDAVSLLQGSQPAYLSFLTEARRELGMSAEVYSEALLRELDW